MKLLSKFELPKISPDSSSKISRYQLIYPIHQYKTISICHAHFYVFPAIFQVESYL